LNRTGRTIFLYCPWPELEGRLRLAAKSRPLLAGRWETTRLRAEKLYKKRLPFYRQADLTVSTAGLSPAQAAKIVGRKL
jgi:shikimate kinase